MAEPWPVHTVVFDLDDTLFAERDYVFSGFQAVDEWIRRERQVTGFAVTANRRFEAGDRGKIFDQTLLELGVTGETGLVDELVRVYRTHRPKLRLLPDALTALEWTRPRFALALISDGYLEVQQAKAAALGLESRLDTLVFTDVWGRKHWKPSPRAFQHVMERHRGSPGGYVYIADNPRKDFIAPRQLGWRTMRVRRPGGEHGDYLARPDEAAELEIADLFGLDRCLEPTEPGKARI